MKLTKAQLKQHVVEELKVILETDPDWGGGHFADHREDWSPDQVAPERVQQLRQRWQDPKWNAQDAHERLKRYGSVVYKVEKERDEAIEREISDGDVQRDEAEKTFALTSDNIGLWGADTWNEYVDAKQNEWVAQQELAGYEAHLEAEKARDEAAEEEQRKIQGINEEKTHTMKLDKNALAQMIKEELEVILTDEEAVEMFGLENMLAELGVREDDDPNLEEALPGVAGQFGEPGSPARKKYCNADPKIFKHFRDDCMNAKKERDAEDALELGRNSDLYGAGDDPETPGARAARLHAQHVANPQGHGAGHDYRRESPYRESRDHASLTKSQLADLIREELESMLGEDTLETFKNFYDARSQYGGAPRKGHFKGPTPEQKAEKKRKERAAAKAAAEEAEKKAEDERLNRIARVGATGVAIEEEETNEGCAGAYKRDDDKKKPLEEEEVNESKTAKPRMKEDNLFMTRDRLAEMIREEMARTMRRNKENA